MLVGTQFVTNPIKNNVCINGRSHQNRRDIPNSYIGQPDCCQFFWKLRELRTVMGVGRIEAILYSNPVSIHVHSGLTL